MKFGMTRSLMLAGLLFGGISAVPAHAASTAVFLWVADGTNLLGYQSNGTLAPGASVAAPSGGDYFSVAVSGNVSGKSNSVYVADSALHTLTEYSWNGTTMSQVGTVAFANDPSGGAISPQEIALDSTGNLWTTSFDGQIVEYSSSLGTPSTIESANGALQGARGMMIVGSNVYDTVQGTYGSGGVYDFSTSTPGTINTFATLGSSTSGSSEAGQMRGITEDKHGDIFYADTTWGTSTNTDGYICEGATCSSSSGRVVTGLNGPNELVSGTGSKTGVNGSGCNVIYLADYYAGDVEEFSTGRDTSGASTTACGNGAIGTPVVFATITGKNVTGLALTPVTGITIGGNEDVAPGPTFIETEFAAPEPSTVIMLGGAMLLIALTVKVRRLA